MWAVAAGQVFAWPAPIPEGAWGEPGIPSERAGSGSDNGANSCFNPRPLRRATKCSLQVHDCGRALVRPLVRMTLTEGNPRECGERFNRVTSERRT